ncbi:MAG TPA: V-type ATPase subunit [Thermoanaerobaculia bacterium]|nr:V-type ATPase subunit [Thermoanaerobaculia bacterium]
MRENAADGFPTDYLIARIRGRQTALISDWERLIALGGTQEESDEQIWGAFLQELEWLQVQMNRRLRDMFASLFVLFEIKTIVLCLRNKAAARTPEIDEMLARSLLANHIKAILRQPADVRSAVAMLADAMAVTSPAFRELDSAYAEGNLQGFENALMRIYLQEISTRRLQPVMKMFFILFTDLRNLVLLYKDLRWGVATSCPFISGGSIDAARLQEIARRRDTAALDDLVSNVTGVDTISAANESALETILLRSMTRKLLVMRHTDDGAALIVVYMWRIYVQARNLAVLHHGVDLDAETLERELVL